MKTLLLLLLLSVLGCGVKSDPIPPKGTMLPSYPDKFLQPNPDHENMIDEIENQKKSSKTAP